MVGNFESLLKAYNGITVMREIKSDLKQKPIKMMVVKFHCKNFTFDQVLSVHKLKACNVLQECHGIWQGLQHLQA